MINFILSPLFRINKHFLKKIPLFIFLGALFFLCLPSSLPEINEKRPLFFIAGQCDDDVRAFFFTAIKRAKRSILLEIYSLNDAKILKILKKKRDEGVLLKVIVDKSNSAPVRDLATVKEKSSGLMHRKILCIDEETVLIGSANFTSTSLRTHDNLVLALHSPAMAKSLWEEKGGRFVIGGQRIDLYLLPQDRKEAFQAIKNSLDEAKESLKIAMFTWTHPLLTTSVIEAQKRGVGVEVVLDATSSVGTSKKSYEQLFTENIDVKINAGSPLLHHKYALIDEKRVVMGSSNWTKAAFSKNDECILIIHDLTKREQQKLRKLWHALQSTAERKSKSEWQISVANLKIFSLGNFHDMKRGILSFSMERVFIS